MFLEEAGVSLGRGIRINGLLMPTALIADRQPHRVKGEQRISPNVFPFSESGTADYQQPNK